MENKSENLLTLNYIPYWEFCGQIWFLCITFNKNAQFLCSSCNFQISRKIKKQIEIKWKSSLKSNFLTTTAWKCLFSGYLQNLVEKNDYFSTANITVSALNPQNIWLQPRGTNLLGIVV